MADTPKTSDATIIGEKTRDKTLEGIPETTFLQKLKSLNESIIGFMGKIALIMIFIAIFMYYVFPLIGQTRSPNGSNNDTFGVDKNSDVMTKWQIFETEFKNFELKYKDVIPFYGIKMLKVSVKDMITRDKFQLGPPAVILLISSERNQNILECFERDFVDIINKAYNEIKPIVINGKQTNSRDIIDNFDQNFRDQNKHTIVIKNVESIEAQDMMSLHQFTDHEYAKYTDAVIVMTAINSQEINLNKNATIKEMTSIGTQLLNIKLNNNVKDPSFALINRLTPSVVTIIGESDNQFKC